MFAGATWRIAWKEYRTQRPLWLAIAVLAVLVQLGVQIAATVSGQAISEQVLFAIAMVATAVYALGCGATLYATERETGTFEFQRGLPLAWRPLLAGKAGFGAVSVVALALLLWSVTIALAGGRLPSWRDGGELWGGGLLAAWEVYAWSLLFSLLLDRPLLAAVLGVLVPSAFVHVAAPAVVGFDYQSVGFRHYLALVPWRVGIVLAVCVADIRLARRWLCETGPSGGPQADTPGRRRTEVHPTAAPTGKHWADVAEAAAATRLRGGFWRLVWQHWYQARCTIGAISLAYIAAIVLSLQADRPSSWNDIPLVWLVPAAALWGVALFVGDQRRRAYRYFAERGVRPRLVWLSRQVLGAAPLIVWMAVAVVFWALCPQSERGQTRWPPPKIDPWFAGGAICGALLAYTAGQACSMFFRSAILAFVGTVFSSLVLVYWLVLMRAAEISWWWSVLPIPVVLLAATWRRAPDWILDRTGWAARRRLAVTLAGPAAVLAAAVMLVRIYEIPWVEPGFDVDEFLAPPTAEQLETLGLYQRAAASARGMSRDIPAASSSPSAVSERVETPEPTLDEQRRWAAENGEVIALLLEASRRPPCGIWDPAGGQWRVAGGFHLLDELLLASAAALVADGKLDEAWERYVAALRIANEERLRGCAGSFYSGDRIEEEVCGRLPAWASHPQQTSDRIKAAIRELERLSRDVPSATSIIKDTYVEGVRPLEGDFRRVENDDAQSVRMLRLVYTLLPWETARARRLATYFTAINLARVHALEQAITSGAMTTRSRFVSDAKSGPRALEMAQSAVWTRTTPMASRWSLHHGFYLDHLISQQEMYRRVVRVQLAILAWRHEHGQFPERLDELVGPYFDQLPLDPCCGRPFRYEPKGWPRATHWRPPNFSERWYRSMIPTEAFVIPAGCPLLWSPGYVDLPATAHPDEPPTLLMQGNMTAYAGYLFPVDPKNNPLPPLP